MPAGDSGPDRQSPEATAPPTPRWFTPGLLVCALVGLAVRVAFVTTVTFPRIANDATFFRTTALNLADGNGYSFPSPIHPRQLAATAAHPPLFPGLLSIVDLLGLRTVTEQRVVLAILGGSAVVAMGLLGRKVAGPTVGIVAASIAAVHPMWLQPIGSLMSESVYLVAIPVMLLLALRCLEEPSVGRFVVLGAVIALAVLIRSEAIDFLVLLGVPLLLFCSVPWRRRGVLGFGLLLGAAVILAPWLIRNEVQVGGAVLSDQEGLTLAGSYCSSTLDPHSSTYGSFDGLCADGSAAYFVRFVPPPNKASGWTELALDRALTDSTESYARAHLSTLPRVVVAREASTWGLGNQGYQLDLAVYGGRNRTYEELGGLLYWISVPFAIFGAVILARRSWARFFVVLAPIAVVVLTVALTYGDTRFRVAAEPSLALLAALGAVALVDSLNVARARGRLLQVPDDPAPNFSEEAAAVHGTSSS